MPRAYFARSYRKVSRCFQSMSELQRFLCNLCRILGCNVPISTMLAWRCKCMTSTVYRTCLIFPSWLPFGSWLWMLAYVLIYTNQWTYFACLPCKCRRSILVIIHSVGITRTMVHGVDSHTMSPKLIRILRTVFVLARDKSLAQTLSKIYSTWKATMIRLYRWMLQDAFVACWIKFGASRVSCIRKCVKHFSKQSCKLQ